MQPYELSYSKCTATGRENEIYGKLRWTAVMNGRKPQMNIVTKYIIAD